MGVRIIFDVDTRGLKKLSDEMNAVFKKRPRTFKRFLDRWGKIYADHYFKTYDAFSRGMGPWRPLADSTVMEKGHDLILIDTKTLRQSFAPRIDKRARRIPDGFAFKFNIGSKAKHPKAKMSINKLAGIHALTGRDIRLVYKGTPRRLIKRIKKDYLTILKEIQRGRRRR